MSDQQRVIESRLSTLMERPRRLRIKESRTFLTRMRRLFFRLPVKRCTKTFASLLLGGWVRLLGFQGLFQKRRLSEVFVKGPSILPMMLDARSTSEERSLILRSWGKLEQGRLSSLSKGLLRRARLQAIYSSLLLSASWTMPSSRG